MVSSFVFMKVLESTSRRYDRGMRLLSRGRIDGVYTRIAELVAAPGHSVLDVGCGTGGAALACAGRGAAVVGIDLDAGMLEVARSKPLPFGPSGTVEWLQLSAAEIEDRFEPSSFDGITACLVMSEMSPDERAHMLALAPAMLRPGGRLVVADEAQPASTVRRALHRLSRLPLATLTYVLTQTTTRAVHGLAEQLESAGFLEIEQERPWPAFVIAHGLTPLDAA
jgi:demethylmenaquinone methyltransferase/2-methoxy-6-polyprenyl-1,4-benzoquinol methylase